MAFDSQAMPFGIVIGQPDDPVLSRDNAQEILQRAAGPKNANIHQSVISREFGLSDSAVRRDCQDRNNL